MINIASAHELLNNCTLPRLWRGQKRKGKDTGRRTGVRIVVDGSTHAPNGVREMEGLIAKDREKEKEDL